MAYQEVSIIRCGPVFFFTVPWSVADAFRSLRPDLLPYPVHTCPEYCAVVIPGNEKEVLAGVAATWVTMYNVGLVSTLEIPRIIDGDPRDMIGPAAAKNGGVPSASARKIDNPRGTGVVRTGYDERYPARRG